MRWGSCLGGNKKLKEFFFIFIFFHEFFIQTTLFLEIGDASLDTFIFHKIERK